MRTAAFLPALLLLASVAGAAEGIEWQADPAAAKKLAEESGRPLVLYFTFDT